MLQNARVTAFTVSMLLRENQQRGGGGVSIKQGIKQVSKFNLFLLNLIFVLLLSLNNLAVFSFYTFSFIVSPSINIHIFRRNW